MRSDVPHGWDLPRIGDFAWEVSERSVSGVEEVLSVTKHRGFVPSLEYFGKQVFSKDVDNYKRVRRGQFAYATIHLDEGSIDSLRIRDEGIISPMYTVFDTDSTKVDEKYLLELLQTPVMLDRYARIGQGSINRRKSISFDTLSSERIPLPPLAEQRKIAAILTSVDEAIQATEAVIAQTRRVKEGLLQELLTKGIGHTRFKQTEIGEIPETWEVQQLCQVGKIFTGGTPPAARTEFWGKDLPFITPGDISDFSDVVAASARGLSKIALGSVPTVPSNSILVVCIGATIGKAGLCVDTSGFNQQINAVVPALHDPKYVYYSITRIRDLMISHSGNQAVPIINKSTFGRLLIGIPPLFEQKQIVSIVSAIEDASVESNRSLLALQQLKSGLLQDLLTGRVRVTP